MYRLATSFWVSSRAPSPQGLSVAPYDVVAKLKGKLRIQPCEGLVVDALLHAAKRGLRGNSLGQDAVNRLEEL